MSEFSIIDRFCRGIGPQHQSTLISVGDDAAVVTVPPDQQLAVSVDTMAEGVHFFADTRPEDLAHKLLAVNLSDMAAMGAQAKWATLALTLPTPDESWLKAFSGSLDAMARHYGVQLIGGDTTKGSLTLSLNIMGLLPKFKALTRSGAKAGDLVFVSNTLGDAALALQHLNGKLTLSEAQLAAVLPSLHRPEPQTALGIKLLDFANACLDISDGLVADLSHIAKASGVSIELDVASIPVSQAYQQYMDGGGNLELALSGGDDYQLAFTVASEQRAAVFKLGEALAIKLSQIGKVVKQQDRSVSLMSDGKPFQLATSSGYQHFE